MRQLSCTHSVRNSRGRSAVRVRLPGDGKRSHTLVQMLCLTSHILCKNVLSLELKAELKKRDTQFHNLTDRVTQLSKKLSAEEKAKQSALEEVRMRV